MAPTSPTRMYFAGVNGAILEEATAGNRVLLTFAEYLKSPKLWDRHRALLEAGHWRGAILDSGAFTELSQRKRGKTFTVPVEAYAAFVAANGHLFDWCANLDDIEGDTARSNANLELIRAAAPEATVVPVYHEGEPREQLERCIADARQAGGLLALGAQRPKGKLRPTQVVRFLHQVREDLRELGAWDILVHGFGFPRYAAPDARLKELPEAGFALPSVDSTTWIAEGCAAFRAGCTATRLEALKATVDSYQGAGFRRGIEAGLPLHGVAFDHDAAADPAAHGQARTVSRRLKAAPAPIVTRSAAAAPTEIAQVRALAADR